LKHEVLLVINIQLISFACRFVTDVTFEMQSLHDVRLNMTDYIIAKLKRWTCTRDGSQRRSPTDKGQSEKIRDYMTGTA